MTTRKIAEAFPPGDFIREELESRGWTQSDLAQIMGRPVQLVVDLLGNRRGITPETAKNLGAALGSSAEFWLDLDRSYRLWLLQSENDESISRRARLYTKAPISEMFKRGWITPTANIDVLERQVKSFYGINELSDTVVFKHAARKGTSYAEPENIFQIAWLCRSRQLAQSVHAANYDASGLTGLIQQLKRLMASSEETRHVPKILAEYGVRFVVVQHLTSSKIDGACFWLGQSPVIAMSLRYDRIDNFWFTLLHEIGHCFYRHELSIDEDLQSVQGQTDRPEQERKADEFAQDHIINRAELKSFILRKRPLYSRSAINGFASLHQTHPGIVVGQLQNLHEVAWSNFRNALVPVRKIVTSSALTDGWGTVVSPRL